MIATQLAQLISAAPQMSLKREESLDVFKCATQSWLTLSESLDYSVLAPPSHSIRPGTSNMKFNNTFPILSIVYFFPICYCKVGPIPV